MAVLSVLWSVEWISPDLLLAGVVLFAFDQMLDSKWYLRPGVAFSSGILWGLAYLVKAVGLPLGILICLGMAVLWRRDNPKARWEIARSAGLTLAGLALVAGPWVAVLSEHYGRLTVSTSAIHNHALVGPLADSKVHLLDKGFRQPERGRVTIWEDPPLPCPDWSPWENWRNAAHQVGIMARNTSRVLYILFRLSLVFPLLAALALIQPVKFRTNPDDGAHRIWFLWPVAALGLVYLPNYLMTEELRYFYAASPLLFVGAAALLLRCGTSWTHWQQRLAAIVLAGSMLFPALGRFDFYTVQTRLAGRCADFLAYRMARAGLVGPVAGSGMFEGGRVGLYTAYFLGQPWFGDELSPHAADFKGSGASFIVVRRKSAIARELQEDASFLNLDQKLFTPEEAKHFPVQVFERK